MVAQIDLAYIKARPSRLWSRLLSYSLFEGRPLTTRGQWINPLLKCLFYLQKRLPQMRGVRMPVFILGVGRSGTTILGMVLSMHRDLGFLNEPKLIWSTLRNDEDLIGSYHSGHARYRLTEEDATKSLVRDLHRIYGLYLGLTMTNRVVDKYPELIFRTRFVRKIFPDAKFIFLSRSGEATCSSIDGWSKRLGTEADGETQDWWGANDRKWRLLVEQLVPEHPDLAENANEMGKLDSTGRAAVEWIVTMREGIHLLKHDNRNLLHVPYEALCAEPVRWALSLQEFLGLDRDAVFERYTASTLVDPAREIALELPDWLRPIFNATEAELERVTLDRRT